MLAVSRFCDLFSLSFLGLLALGSIAEEATAQTVEVPIEQNTVTPAFFDSLTRGALDASDRFNGHIHDRITNTGINEGAWTEGGFNYFSRKGGDLELSYDLESYSLTAGWDKGAGDNYIYGFAGHLTSGNLDAGINGSRSFLPAITSEQIDNSSDGVGLLNSRDLLGDLTSYGLAVYGGTNFREGFNVTFSAGYDRLEFDLDRQGMAGEAALSAGSFGTFYSEARFSNTYEYETLIWRPVVALDLVAVGGDRFREQGPFGSSRFIERDSQDFIGATIGHDFFLRYETENHLFIPYAGVFYRYFLNDIDRMVTVAGTDILQPMTFSIADDRHSVEYRIGVSGDFYEERLFFSLGYEGALSDNNQVSRFHIRLVLPF